ncbi:hypothetical protein ACLKA7_003487 [Drosophila subpalustris]
MTSGSADGIIIRSMKVEDYEEVKILLGSSFYPEEPLSKCLGKSLEQVHTQKHDDTLISMIEEDNCLVAVDMKNRDHIVGIILAEAQVPGDVEHMRQRAKNSGHITKFLSKIESEANLFERYKVSKALNLHIICVSESMRGTGLGRRLTSALMDVGRARGFPLLTACCSSFYASRQMQAMGMECAYSVSFEDYKDDNGKVVFQPPPPHTHVKVVVYRL